MNKLISFVVTALLLICFTACDDKNNDITSSPDHDGSIESAITVNHLDSLHDILITKHRIWNHFMEYKTIEYRDTIPTLDIERTTGENQNGDTVSVHVKKDYEIFITVK